jgi:hypothetical protein
VERTDKDGHAALPATRLGGRYEEATAAIRGSPSTPGALLGNETLVPETPISLAPDGCDGTRPLNVRSTPARFAPRPRGDFAVARPKSALADVVTSLIGETNGARGGKGKFNVGCERRVETLQSECRFPLCGPIASERGRCDP